jgi:hypothetical protein
MKTGLKPENRALFEAAREDLAPTDGDRVRVAKALGLSVGVSAGIASATAKAGAASVATSPAVLGVSSVIVAAKWVAVVAIAVGVGIGVGDMALDRAKTACSPSPPAAVSAGAESARESSLPQAPGPVRTRIVGEETPMAPRVQPLPGSPVYATESPKPIDGARARLASSTSSMAAQAGAVPPSEALSAPVQAASSASSPEAAPSAGAAAAAGGVRVAEEAHLLREADAALRAGDTAGAGRFLDDHARLFPHGVLAEERDLQRVVLLCAAGQVAAARVAAGRFLSAYPQSVFAGRVRASCGGQ